MRKPFAIVTLIDKSYAVPGWFSVSLGTKFEDLDNMNFDIKEEPQIKYTPKPKIEELVKSSNGKGKYTVKFNGMYWSCTCKGYGFRRSCRHINEIKENIIK